MDGPASSIILIITFFTLLVLWHPLRPPAISQAAFFISHSVNEASGLALLLLIASAGVLIATGIDVADLVILAIAAVGAAGLVALIIRGMTAWTVVHTAIAEQLELTLPRPPRARLARDLWMPVPFRLPGIARTRNIAYGDGGRRNRLDVYHPRHPASPPRPVLIHFHGGHYSFGAKSRESRALLFRLAQDGSTCVSATYRLRESGRYPHALIDAKRVVAWARAHAPEYGGDPQTVIVAGSSAGAHLASLAVLTAGDRHFQPGWEDVDTSVAGVVGLYGYYGRQEFDRPDSSPAAWVTDQAPPFLIVHGLTDPLVPIAHADAFVQRLRDISRRQVGYIRLPHAGHSFDLFFSPRFEAVVQAVGAFGASLSPR